MPQTKKTMTEPLKYRSWLKALADAAAARQITLPAFTPRGMGTARTAPVADGRFVTFKRRLVSEAEADVDGVEWTFWREVTGLPQPVAAFREPQHPQPEGVAAILALITGWLIEGWTADDTKAAVGARRPTQALQDLARGGSRDTPAIELHLDHEDLPTS